MNFLTPSIQGQVFSPPQNFRPLPPLRCRLCLSQSTERVGLVAVVMGVVDETLSGTRRGRGRGGSRGCRGLGHCRGPGSGGGSHSRVGLLLVSVLSISHRLLCWFCL